jgi:hypothetical protein
MRMFVCNFLGAPAASSKLQYNIYNYNIFKMTSYGIKYLQNIKASYY